MWYSALILLRSDGETRQGEKQTGRLYQESVHLLQADNEDDAQQVANELGVSLEHAYSVEDGSIVTWLFNSVEKLTPIDEPRPGLEVFSRFLTKEEVESFRRKIE